jgi:hypothetical protein
MPASKLSDAGGTASSGSYGPEGHAKSSLDGQPARTTSGAGVKSGDGKKTGKGK